MAGKTMADVLRAEYHFTQETDSGNLMSPEFKNVELFITPSDLLYQEDLDKVFPRAEAYVFLSKHKSDSKIPTLTCHCTGNFGSNPYGGNPRELAIAFPSLQKSYLKSLVRRGSLLNGYDIAIEATHHGPTSLKKPVLFVELGSSEIQWADRKAAKVVCDSILDVTQNGPERSAKTGIGLGGTHYPSKFNHLLLESEFGLAAVASKHSLESVDRQMLQQMVSKSIEKVTTVVLDGKGLGSHKERIMRLAQDSGLEILILK
jgi:D-aminoacyl-tRNA deacylase